MCCKAGGKLEDPCLSNADEKIYCECIDSHHKEPELILQGGTEATSQEIPDLQPLTPPQDTTEGEKKRMRVEKMSNERPAGMKEGRLRSPTNLENPGYLYPQLHSPDRVLTVHPHQDWNHGQKTEHRGMTCQEENPLEAEDMCCEAYSNYEMADYLIKNYKGQKTKHWGMCLQERKSSDEQNKNCKANGKMEDTYLERYKTCKKVHYKGDSSHYQQPSCSVYSQPVCVCRNYVYQTQTQAQAGTLELTTKPPDMSIYRDRS